MSGNVNQSPFLKQQRSFPADDINDLATQMDLAYVSIAEAVNARVIGQFAKATNTTTGEIWFVTSRRQQTLRKVFTFSAAGSIAHGINTTTIGGFTRIYGTFTNGTNWYPLPYVDATAANNQVSVVVTSTNIVITAGGGSPPAITSGYVVVEYLSNS